jgi:Spy/CpxP family protein refolding chaperone
MLCELLGSHVDGQVSKGCLKMSEGNGNGLKVAGAAVLLIGALVFVWMQYRSARPALPPPAVQAQGRDFGGPRMDPAQRGRMREQMLQSMNLSPEQRQRLEEIDQQFANRTDPQSRRERMQAVSAVFTPEQRDAMRGQMRQRMAQRLSILPPDQRELFMQKLEERRRNRGGGRGWGGGPRGRGPNAPAQPTPSGTPNQ